MHIHPPVGNVPAFSGFLSRPVENQSVQKLKPYEQDIFNFIKPLKTASAEFSEVRREGFPGRGPDFKQWEPPSTVYANVVYPSGTFGPGDQQFPHTFRLSLHYSAYHPKKYYRLQSLEKDRPLTLEFSDDSGALKYRNKMGQSWHNETPASLKFTRHNGTNLKIERFSKEDPGLLLKEAEGLESLFQKTLDPSSLTRHFPTRR